MIPLVKINILSGEQNLCDNGDRSFPAIEKVTQLGSLQIQPRPLTATKSGMLKDTAGAQNFLGAAQR